MGLRRLLAALVAVVGAGLVVFGVSMVFVPAAVILAGLLLAAVGLLADWGS